MRHDEWYTLYMERGSGSVDALAILNDWESDREHLLQGQRADQQYIEQLKKELKEDREKRKGALKVLLMEFQEWQGYLKLLIRDEGQS